MAATLSPAACWWWARPFTASASPPVRAYGKYSAVTWTTDTGSPPAAFSGARDSAPARDCWCTVAILPASCRRRIVAGRFAPDRGRVVLLDVVREHSPRGESGARQPERVAHLLDPSERDAGGVASVVQRNDLLLQQTIEPVDVGGVGVLALARRRDRPPAQTVVALLPPAVERAQLRDSVECRLHATGPAGLERNPGQVEPEVHALHQEVRQVHVVVLEKRHASLELGVAGELVDALAHFLARIVRRMRLPGEDDLDRTPGVHQHAPQTLEIPEHQVGALVGGEPAGEPDRERRRIEQRPRADHLRRLLHLIGEPTPGILTDEVGEDLLQPDVDLPELLVVERQHLVPQPRVVESASPVIAQVFVQQAHDRARHPGGQM